MNGHIVMLFFYVPVKVDGTLKSCLAISCLLFDYGINPFGENLYNATVVHTRSTFAELLIISRSLLLNEVQVQLFLKRKAEFSGLQFCNATSI